MEFTQIFCGFRSEAGGDSDLQLLRLQGIGEMHLLGMKIGMKNPREMLGKIWVNEIIIHSPELLGHEWG